MKLAIASLAFLACFLAQDKKSDLTVVSPRDLKWVDAPGLPAGVKACLMHGDPKKGPLVAQTKVPAGTVIAPHWHPSDECTTVISGTGMIGQGEKVDESKGTTLEAGGYFVIPAKTPHWFKAVTDCTVIRYSAGAADTTYIEKKDK